MSGKLTAQSAPYETAAIIAIVDGLKAKVPEDDWPTTALPVIAAPRSWLERFAHESGGEPGDLPEKIYHCPVVEQNELDQPIVVTHDGKAYRVWDALPAASIEPGERAMLKLIPGDAYDKGA